MVAEDSCLYPSGVTANRSFSRCYHVVVEVLWDGKTHEE